jgi:hypothetical protein
VSYHQGFLYLSNAYGNAVEVINEARTTANLTSAINAGVLRFGNVRSSAGCAALSYTPCTMSGTGTVTSWAALITGITNSPWYSASFPASSEAYGFFIEEWTGLDGAHHGREVTPFGSGRGGGMLGPQGSGARTMAFNVVLVGGSERGLNYLFRWLESTLLSCCDPNDNPSLYLREYCTASADLTDGLAHVDDVGLIAGPTWESPPVEDAGCYVRRVSFTLVAGSPSFFREPTDVTSGTSLKSAMTGGVTIAPVALSRFVGTSLRVAGTMPTPEYGLVSPVVTFTSDMKVNGSSGARLTLPQMRIYGMLNPGNAALTSPYKMFPIGGLVLNNIPSGATVTVDVGAGKIWYLDKYTSLETVSGMSYLLPRAPTFANGNFLTPDFVGARMKRWFGFNNCQAGVVVVEPDVIDTATNLTDRIVDSWAVDVNAVVRFGSC